MSYKVNKTEALVDALSFLFQSHIADSKGYILRNPILLKNFAPPGKHKVDEEGYRIFDSFLGGYKSAVYDVNIKITGESNSGIKKTDVLRNLLAVYSVNKEADIMLVVFFLRKALCDPSIHPLTPLSYFKEI